MKTHLAITIAAIILLIGHVNNKLVFVGVALVAALIPDVDSCESYFGHRWYLRPLQFFTRHRGIIHSFTICILISIAFAFYIPIIALPFFVGYGLHLIGDSFTIEGIRPFWPLKRESNGGIRTGGVFEDGVYYSFILISIIGLIWIVMSY